MFLFCLFLGLGALSAQGINKRNSIGVQINPYFDSQFFNGFFIKPVYALRYTYNFNSHLSFGPEISGFYIKDLSDQTDLIISTINLGGYFRYSFMPNYRVNPFIELSPYYSLHHFKSSTIVTEDGIGKEYRNDFLTGYVSPGVSLVSKSRKLSLDLFYKFSNKSFVNDKKSVFSYRLNINF
jgi:hypothetical protein